MFIIPKKVALGKVPAKKKFKACHRNRGLPVYSFYGYWAKYHRNKSSNN